MSSANNVVNTTTIISGTNNMTGTAVVTSSTISLKNVRNIGLQFIWTGTPTGTFVVNASNDGTNWFALTTSGISNPAGSASNTGGELFNMPHPFVQVVYTNASGTGSLTVTWAGFGV